MFQPTIAQELLQLVADRPVVALVGPRRVGKTTLVLNLTSQLTTPSIYLDLESAQDLNRLQDLERYLSERQTNLTIIDEIQRMPQLFPLLRSLVDRHWVPGRFILVGSASPQLLQQSSELLAGHVAYLELEPLSWIEVKPQIPYQQHWLRGATPICCWQVATGLPADE